MAVFERDFADIPDGTPLDICLHDDALAVIRSLPDRCIDLVLTDPPWGTSRLRLDADGRPPVDMWRELRRITRPNGWLLCFGTLRMFADVLEAGWVDAWQYIWYKPHGSLNMQPDYHPNLNHETIQVYHLGDASAPDAPPDATRPSDRYYDTEALRTYGHTNYHRRGREYVHSVWHQEHGMTHKKPAASRDGGRHPSSVLLGHQPKAHQPRREVTEHPTQKPTSLMRYLIRGHCPPGGVVFDPYAGSGAALLAARAVGRRYLGVELADRWHAKIQARLVSVLDYDKDDAADTAAEDARIAKYRESRARIRAAAAVLGRDAPSSGVGQTILAPLPPPNKRRTTRPRPDPRAKVPAGEITTAAID